MISLQTLCDSLGHRSRPVRPDDDVPIEPLWVLHELLSEVVEEDLFEVGSWIHLRPFPDRTEEDSSIGYFQDIGLADRKHRLPTAPLRLLEGERRHFR